MPHYYCLCGSTLNTVSSGRSLSSLCLRLFISIRTMKMVTTETRVCDSCRGAYYSWKKNNPEFDTLLSRIQQESLTDNESDRYESSNDSTDSNNSSTTIRVATWDQNSNINNNETIAIQINCSISSHSECCVCFCLMDGNSKTICLDDRDLVLLKKNVLIPEGARCCSQHTINNRLTVEAIDNIGPRSIKYKTFTSTDVQSLMDRWRVLFQQQKHFDFDNPNCFSDDEYQVLTSLTKAQFNDLEYLISQSNIRNSSNRSIRTALAIFLCKLQLGLSNAVLAVLFKLPNKRTVSRSVESIRSSLMRDFVPFNLGFNHIRHQDIIQQHTCIIAQQLMCPNEPDTAIVVIDGTYIYIQKSRNNEFQRKSFNLHKKRSLLKPMMIVSTTGYIIACMGPFLSDFSNNDASIMKNILRQNTDGILNWLHKNDVVVVDRAFRDCIDAMESLGLNVVLLSFLNGRKQFTAYEANESRRVTKIRWVIEAVNARIKQFKFFANIVYNSSIPYLEQYLSIACALINKYRPPIKTSSEQDILIVEKINSIQKEKKNFEKFLDNHSLKKYLSKWQKIDRTEILDDFPILSEDEIITNITLGVYQLKRSRSYAEERTTSAEMTGAVVYMIYRCKEFPDLIKIPTQSAHVNRKMYQPIIRFDKREILDWWCDCAAGSRFVGCCSHVASAIWFLSFERWQIDQAPSTSTTFIDFVSDAGAVIDLSDLDDESDDYHDS